MSCGSIGLHCSSRMILEEIVSRDSILVRILLSFDCLVIHILNPLDCLAASGHFEVGFSIIDFRVFVS